MESVYENLKNHFRRKLSCFRLELLGFDLLKGVAVVLFTFLLFSLHLPTRSQKQVKGRSRGRQSCVRTL